MGKVIAVSNQKGGVAKTTTSINLGVALARNGKRVLLVDADPQGHLSTGLGISKTTKVTLFESKSAGVLRKQQQPAHMQYLQGSYNAHKVSAPNSRSAGTAYVKRKNK